MHCSNYILALFCWWIVVVDGVAAGASSLIIQCIMIIQFAHQNNHCISGSSSLIHRIEYYHYIIIIPWFKFNLTVNCSWAGLDHHGSGMQFIGFWRSRYSFN